MLRAAASRLPRSAPRVHRSLHVGVARPSAPVAARTAVVGGAVAVVVAYECSRGAPARAESLSTLDGLKAMVFGAPDAAAAAPTSKAPAAPAEPAAFDDEFQQHGEQRNKVVVALDAETVEALPVMSLDEVRACDGRARTAGASGDGDEEQQLLVTHDGIVYDVTQFANDHPGGRELLLTAAGQDLKHFFENYLVHARTDKAATWLAPLAVGRLSAEDAARASALTTPAVHVERRLALLWRARRRLLGVVVQLPGWMAVRQLVRFVGQLSRPLGRWLAGLLPVSVPGLSPGAEPLAKGGKVAVIGGGIAGCGAAWALARDGYEVTLYEARAHVSGNARTFDWDGFSDGRTVRSCVSVTAWPPLLYKNYTALLKEFRVETTPMPLSWFVNSKVKGREGFLWAADPRAPPGSLRNVFRDDFARYARAERFIRWTTDLFTLAWAPWKRGDTPSMYTNHTGLGMLNPFNVYPLYALCKNFGVSDDWWNIVFTPHYTASFLVDELRPFPAVFGPIIELQIPLLPHAGNAWQGASAARGPEDCNITTCVTWKDAGHGIQGVFKKLTEHVTLHLDTRVIKVDTLADGRKRVLDEHDRVLDVDRVIFACPSNAVGNMHTAHGPLEDTILSAPVYADDHHPATGHMHGVMHSDASVIAPEFREQCLKRASNYVEVTRLDDGSINIENQYNFGVQTPGPGVYDMPLAEKPVMLISHALGAGKSLDPAKVRGTANHARAHPLYSGWNVMAQLSLRLVQGRHGVYYCSNWTTPGNCHDMSLLSGFICAHAVGAAYPFPEDVEANKDFHRLRDLMGI